jgi:hypothetical protein
VRAAPESVLEELLEELELLLVADALGLPLAPTAPTIRKIRIMPIIAAIILIFIPLPSVVLCLVHSQFLDICPIIFLLCEHNYVNKFLLIVI